MTDQQYTDIIVDNVIEMAMCAAYDVMEDLQDKQKTYQNDIKQAQVKLKNMQYAIQYARETGDYKPLQLMTEDTRISLQASGITYQWLNENVPHEWLCDNL